MSQEERRGLEVPPSEDHIKRLTVLLGGALSPPKGVRRIALAITYGALCHAVFGLAVIAMIASMYYGLSKSWGRIDWPWGLFVNAFLLAQFPLAHSLLLTPRGRHLLTKLPLGRYAGSLSTTTYAIIASTQLLALFTLWTPSGIIWWEAKGATLWLITLCYGASWLLLIKASFDAGPEVQSGALGWLSVLAAKAPVYPDMPQTGLFRVIRQPIYLAFALTLWTVPLWTPDQLVLALTYSAYCLLAPRFKEQRFSRLYGSRFEQYRDHVPYILPRPYRRNGNALRNRY